MTSNVEQFFGLTINDSSSERDTAADNTRTFTVATVVTDDSLFTLAQSPLIPTTLDIIHDEVAILHTYGGLHNVGLIDDNDIVIVIIKGRSHLEEAHHPTGHMTISNTPVVITNWLTLVVVQVDACGKPYIRREKCRIERLFILI